LPNLLSFCLIYCAGAVRTVGTIEEEEEEVREDKKEEKNQSERTLIRR
jgi:hypothetical protein